MSLLLLQPLNKESTLPKADILITLCMQKKLLTCFEKIEAPKPRLALFLVFFEFLIIVILK